MDRSNQVLRYYDSVAGDESDSQIQGPHIAYVPVIMVNAIILENPALNKEDYACVKGIGCSNTFKVGSRT